MGNPTVHGIVTWNNGPPGPSLPTGTTQAQPPLSPTFDQPQGGLHGNSYHMYASDIQHIIAHATATQTKTFHRGGGKREIRTGVQSVGGRKG